VYRVLVKTSASSALARPSVAMASVIPRVRSAGMPIRTPAPAAARAPMTIAARNGMSLATLAATSAPIPATTLCAKES